LARALAHPKYALIISDKLAKHFQEDKVNVVLGFTVGGIILAQNIAKSLAARTVIAEMKNDRMVFAKGYSIKEGDKVLIVDDVLRPPTGDPIRRALKKVENETKGTVVSIGVVVDRSTKDPHFKVKTVRLAKIKFRVWTPESCPLCQRGVPLTDLSSPDTDPLGLLYSLPDEENRPFLANMLRDVFKHLKKGKLLEEILSFYRPLHELHGRKPERVAILGSYDNFSIMDYIARIVSRLRFYAITSRVIYQKDSSKRRELRPENYEAMNDFLRKIIHSCQYIIVIYAGAGGQFIETAWCSESHKPTLGLVPLRPLSFLDLKGCDYLIYSKSKNILFCNGSKAREKGCERIGGWICEKNKNCPFPSSGLSKMILDLYITSRSMFLVGSDNLNNFEEPIRVFLQNKGVLKLDDIF